MAWSKMQDAAKLLPEKIYSILKNFLKKWYFSGEQKQKNFDFIHTDQVPNLAFLQSLIF